MGKNVCHLWLCKVERTKSFTIKFNHLIPIFLGNTARALFDEPEFLSEITSVPIHVINGIKKIWIAIRTTSYMHSEMFHEFAQKVKQDWRAAIPWYPLCASCHKIVEHGHICIRNSNIPVGFLGEDALESFFHDFKVFRYTT